MDLGDAAGKLASLVAGRLPASLPRQSPVVGIMPVHVSGSMMDVPAVRAFARERQLWTIEDAAHAFPAAYRPKAGASWQSVRRRDSRCVLFLLLREQDDHDRGGGDGRHR